MSTVFDTSSMEKAFAGAAAFAEIIKQIPAMQVAITSLTAENKELKAKIAANDKNVSSAELTAAQEKIAKLTAELDASKLELSRQRATNIALTEKFDALKALFESPVNIQDTIKVVPAPAAQVAAASPKPVAAASPKPVAAATAPICWGDSAPASPKRVEKALEVSASSNMEKSSETPAPGKLNFAEAAAKKSAEDNTTDPDFKEVVSRSARRAEKAATVEKKSVFEFCAEFVLTNKCVYGDKCPYIHTADERPLVAPNSGLWCAHSTKENGCTYNKFNNRLCCFMHGQPNTEKKLIKDLSDSIGTEMVIAQQRTRFPKTIFQ